MASPYIGMDVAWLTTRKAELQAALSAALTRGSAFSQPDLSMTFPSLKELRQDLADVNAALAVASGSSSSIVIARLN